MKVSVLTLGCRVNQSESASIERSLVDLGFSLVPLSGQPEYCIINTCSVTAKSDYQSRQLIRRAVRSGARVLVTGCYAELRAGEVRGIAGPITIIRNDKKTQIGNMLTGETKSVTLCWSGRSRPYIKMQDGCNFSCTYCVVPKARGKSRSTGLSEIVDRIAEFESLGYNEVVLTGIHLGSYGKDLEPKLKLSIAIETILNNTNIQRIRLSSIELNEIDAEIIALLQEERLCRHLHVPLQSGDDDVLRRMNRGYRAADYVRVISAVAAKVDGIAIGADVIVGFPGEGEKEFQNTKSLIESLPMAYLHIFPFSSRPGTPASRMGGQVIRRIKEERYAHLNALNRAKKLAYMTDQIGKTLDVIVEEREDEGTVLGTTGNYLKMRVCSDNYLEKSHIQTRVSDIQDGLLVGFPIAKT